MILRLLPLFFSLLYLSNAARLILSTMDQGRSHAGSFLPLAQRIQSKANHSVHLQMTIYQKEIDMGLKEEYIELYDSTSPFASSDFSVGMWHDDFTVFRQNLAYSFGAAGCRASLTGAPERVRQIAGAHWDLAMVDSLFATCGYGIAQKSGAPIIYMHSSDMEPAPGTMKAFGRNYGILPKNHMTHGLDDMNPQYFWHRLLSTIEWGLGYYFYAIRWGGEMRETLAPLVENFDWIDFHRRVAFNFVDMPDVLFPPAPRTNDVFFYGAYCPPVKPLPEEWREFVEDPESKGTIVIAFGTLVDWSCAPKEKRDAIRLAINNLTDYRIVWSYKGVDDWKTPPISVGSHVRIFSWIPQSGLLNHPKTVLFLTHGGLKSVREATCAAVSTIFMPFFAEQARNAFLVRRAGFAEMLDRHTITKESVLEKINTVLSDTTHAKAAKKVVREMLDRPMDALDEGVFYVNRLLKTRGGKQGMPEYFYPHGRLLGFVEYLNLDILIGLPLIFIAVLSL